METAVKAPPATIRRLDPALGAEIIGLDVSQPLDDDTVAWLRTQLDQYGMLCLRDQVLTGEQQLAFTERWGPLEIYPEEDRTVEKTTLFHVANTAADGTHLPESDHQVVLQKVNAWWHTDSSYRFIPAYASLLYGIEVLPDGAQGGRTAFANTLAAYDALSPQMKARIEPLHMVHSFEHGRRMFPQLPPLSKFEKDTVPPVCHPLVRVHPDRGNRRSLFMTSNTGTEISGMSLEDGQALHRELVEHLSRPEFCYFHRWRERDLVIWDNRVMSHKAEPYDMGRYRRVFRRTTLAGKGPVLGPFSQAVTGKY